MLIDLFDSVIVSILLAAQVSLLQLGHRLSEDFDFFTYTSFNNDSLFGEIKELFPEFLLNVMQNEKDTFTVLLNDEIKISFLN